MTQTKDAALDFLTAKRVAVTGVSRAPQGHGSNAVYNRLKERGYEVFAVNPNAEQVEGDATYPTLAAIPGGVEAVVIGTRPEHAMNTMREAAHLGISTVWMHRSFGAGSVSAEATAYGRAHGITVIDGGCPLMFGRRHRSQGHVLVDAAHRQGAAGSVRSAVSSSRTWLLRGAALVGSGFVAATALFGGVELLTGWPRQLPTEWLDGTPFDSYAVPGLLLGGLVGGSAVSATWAAARRSLRWPQLTAAAGAVMMGWTVAEVAILNQLEAPTAVELFYAGLGLLNAVVGTTAWRRSTPRRRPRPDSRCRLITLIGGSVRNRINAAK